MGVLELKIVIGRAGWIRSAGVAEEHGREALAFKIVIGRAEWIGSGLQLELWDRNFQLHICLARSVVGQYPHCLSIQ